MGPTMVGALGPTPGLRAPTTVAGRVPLGALLPPVVSGLVLGTMVGALRPTPGLRTPTTVPCDSH